MKKIIVVDDQQDIRNLLKTILMKKGFYVLTDEHGDVFNENHSLNADLIILDVNLGGKSGAQICRELKASAMTKEVPILLLSAEPNLSQISRDCHADDFLVKPFSTKHLLEKVAENLRAA